MEGLLGSCVSVEARIQGVIGESGFGRDYETCVEFLQIWTLGEEVQDLGGMVVHQSVVHEDGWESWKVWGGDRVPNGVGWVKSVVLQFSEIGVHACKLVEFAWFHEHDRAGSCGLERPMDVKEKRFDGLVGGVGVVGCSQTRCWDSVGVEEGEELFWHGPGVGRD